jgi:hypothetical protein
MACGTPSRNDLGPCDQTVHEIIKASKLETPANGKSALSPGFLPFFGLVTARFSPHLQRCGLLRL